MWTVTSTSCSVLASYKRKCKPACFAEALVFASSRHIEVPLRGSGASWMQFYCVVQKRPEQNQEGLPGCSVVCSCLGLRQRWRACLGSCVNVLQDLLSEDAGLSTWLLCDVLSWPWVWDQEITTTLLPPALHRLSLLWDCISDLPGQGSECCGVVCPDVLSPRAWVCSAAL